MNIAITSSNDLHGRLRAIFGASGIGAAADVAHFMDAASVEITSVYDYARFMDSTFAGTEYTTNVLYFAAVAAVKEHIAARYPQFAAEKAYCDAKALIQEPPLLARREADRDARRAGYIWGVADACYLIFNEGIELESLVSDSDRWECYLWRAIEYMVMGEVYTPPAVVTRESAESWLDQHFGEESRIVMPPAGWRDGFDAPREAAAFVGRICEHFRNSPEARKSETASAARQEDIG